MRVLMLGSWAVARPRHGGQTRAASIIEAYRERGHDAMFIDIFDPGNVSLADTGPNDIAINDTVMEDIARCGKPSEISLWQAFADVPELLAQFEAAVCHFGPDVVQFEEPYLWPIVRVLRQRGRLGRARVTHSSYNFETDDHRDLMKIGGNAQEIVSAQIATQEAEIARESDLVVTVSDADAASFRRIGAHHVVVAQNGSRRPEPTPEALKALDAYLGQSSFALFVNSAHPPNASPNTLLQPRASNFD